MDKEQQSAKKFVAKVTILVAAGMQRLRSVDFVSFKRRNWTDLLTTTA
ncbi:hypothetical protein [Pseudomonas bohemica]|nr:hypothetical protein [Pseudomonas bohemica]